MRTTGEQAAGELAAGEEAGREQPGGEAAGSAPRAADSSRPPVPAGRPGTRRKLVAVGVVIVVAAGTVAAWAAGAFGKSGAPEAPAADSTALATVTRQSVSSQEQVNGTLGYAGNYSVVVLSAAGGSQSPGTGQGSGTGTGTGAGQQGGSPAAVLTALPSAGQLLRSGQGLYSVNGSPTVLLYGSIPAYRTLSEGMSGADVRELNANLVALKEATSSQLNPHSSYFSVATASALDKLQASLGVTQTGSLALGQAVFLPTAVRVTSVSASLGAPVQAGSQALQATSTTRQVTAQIDPTQQSHVTVGDHVTITLPDNQTTPGIVTSVGTVATTPSSGASGSSGSGSSGSGSTPTINVDVRPVDPAATGKLDQAPVQVTITTGTATNALVVPVDALVARASGGYAVEVAGAHGARHLVPVSLGIFDDAAGLVQVTATGLAAGQQVVVPKI